MDRGLGSLGLVDAVSRLVAIAWRRGLEDEIPRGVKVAKETKEVEVVGVEVRDEVVGLRRRIERLEEREIEEGKVEHVGSRDFETLSGRMKELEAHIERIKVDKIEYPSRKSEVEESKGVSLANIVLLSLVVVLVVPYLRAYISAPV